MAGFVLPRWPPHLSIQKIPNGIRSPIKGRVKEKNTSPQEKTCRFFFDTLAVLDLVYSCCLFCFAPVISVYGSRGL